jgi:hypothetical protein
MTNISRAVQSVGFAVLLSPLGAAAQTPARVPFGPGEEAIYQVKLGFINAGEARLAIMGVDTVRGAPTYALEMDLRASALGFKVNNSMLSWLDTRTLATRRLIQDTNQSFYTSYRDYEIFPEERRWERKDNDERATMRTPLPLDDLAFIYYVRTLPLVVGETYTLTRYFKDNGNPVVIQVIGKGKRETPAGTFNTIIVKPTIQTTGLFSEGGNAEIHFSDDTHRHVVYLRTELPLVGSLTLQLAQLRAGTPLARGR